MTPHANLRQRKGQGTWYAEFCDPTRKPMRKRVSLQTTDKATAARRFAKLEREWETGERDPWTNKLHVREGTTVADAVGFFIKDRAKYCAESSVGVTEAILTTFVASLPPTFPLYGVEERHVRAWLNNPRPKKDGTKSTRKLKPTTRRDYLSRLRTFYYWAIEEGLIKDTPVPKEKKSKESRWEDLPSFLSERDLERLLAAVAADSVLKSRIISGNQWLTDAIVVAVGTGLRRAELCAMRWSWVNLEGRMLTVKNSDVFTTKSGRERAVPLAGEALKILQRLYEERATEADGIVLKGADGGPIDSAYLSKRFRFYRKLAKLDPAIHFHSLRHTFASRLVERGVDLYRVQHLLGHADQRMTQRYSHLRPEGLRQAVEATFGGGPFPVPGPKESGTGNGDPAEEIRRLEARLAALKEQATVKAG
jgi:integrase